jgi:hypothetical protein
MNWVDYLTQGAETGAAVYNTVTNRPNTTTAPVPAATTAPKWLVPALIGGGLLVVVVVVFGAFRK